MAQPLYFIPNIEARDLVKGQRLCHDVLRAHGLSEVFADVAREDEVSIQEFRSKGPGGQSGVIFCYLKENATRDVPQHLGYYPDCQKWELRTCGLPAWIGWNPAQPPTPDDLRRRRLQSGYFVEDMQGRPWQVPIIRRPDDSTELPRDMHLAGDGSLHETVADVYREYWDESALVCEWFLNPTAPAESIGFSKDKAFRLAVRALSLNYRLGHAEQRICKAVDSTNYLTVLAWSVDKPRFDAVTAAAKKKQSSPPTANSTPGAAADSPATAPAAPISGSLA